MKEKKFTKLRKADKIVEFLAKVQPINTVFYQVYCAYEYSVQQNFSMIFGNFYFYFSRIISKESVIASLFIIKAILNPFSATFHV
jgi:hypothetical protein